MTSRKEKQTKEVFKLFKKLKVLTIIKLTAILMCSERTIQRRLKIWGTYTSYNKNCRYYTLPDIPNLITMAYGSIRVSFSPSSAT